MLIFRFFAALVLRIFYRVKVTGAENVAKAGDRVVIVANHVSFLDALLLLAFLPGRPTFAVDTQISKLWWMRPAMRLFSTVAIDPTNPLSAKTLVKAVRNSRQCVIFPEGRITVTGSLMKVHEGPAMIADKSDAVILPVRIDGAQYTAFSRMRGKVRLRWFPKISLTVLPPQKIEVDPALSGRARRQEIGLKLHDLMAELVFETCNLNSTLFGSLLDARKIHGGRTSIVEDIQFRPASYNRLIDGSIILGRALKKIAAKDEFVGVLLPNSVAATVTFFALQAYGRVPALINFATGSNAISACCSAAQIRTVLTSRQFVTAAKLQQGISELQKQVRVIYLEDVRSSIGILAKVGGLIVAKTPLVRRLRHSAKPGNPAVVLFTSGSEGTPKGVVLSHANIIANRHQLGAIIDFNSSDRVLNALPIFHSFGLTGGLILPLLSGVRTFLYPSPLHYRVVPQLAYGTNATILFGTDTFLAGYAKSAHPYDFYSVRYVFAGAERLRKETQNLWFEKFGLRILEGYGATETSPVIAVNTPMHYKSGCVGRFVPGIKHQLISIPGLSGAGKLILSGPNVMLGYLRVENPGEITAPQDGIYDTGDIVQIDHRGFVTIEGRAKRFAKIAGEMVSLAAVEQAVSALWPDHNHAATILPDEKKGEQIVLVTDMQDSSRDRLAQHMRSIGMSEISLPRRIVRVANLPLLATGKVDHGAISQIADREFVSAAPALADSQGGASASIVPGAR